MKVTRDVISDLWPVYESGEATADTRAIVEDYLAQDAAFAATLRGGLKLPAMEAQMNPDSETLALKRTRDLVQGRAWLRGMRLVALVLTIFAAWHALADTTWTPSPRLFVFDTIAAAICWTIYTLGLSRERRRALTDGGRAKGAKGAGGC
jgi:hypothetical protein